MHPLEDGNGRIARTLTDLALAQDERSGLRFCSLSAQFALAPGNPDGALSNRAYRAVTQAIRTTATRDLAHLVQLGLLAPTGEKRGAAYRVPLELFLQGNT